VEATSDVQILVLSWGLFVFFALSFFQCFSPTQIFFFVLAFFPGISLSEIIAKISDSSILKLYVCLIVGFERFFDSPPFFSFPSPTIKWTFLA